MKKVMLILNFVMFVCSAQAYASDLPLFEALPLITTLGNTLGSPVSNAAAVKLKNGVDETQNPTVRRGTENWEESQISFFIVPAVSIGLVLLFLIFNRNKD